MPKKKSEKEIEVIYEYVGDTEESRQRMEKAYDIIFDATLRDKTPFFLKKDKIK
jgi:hypothetical protein